MPSLTEWPEIPKHIENFRQMLKTDQDLLQSLDEAIDEQAGHPEVPTGTPGKHSDRTANLAIQLIERREDIVKSIRVWNLSIKEKEHDIKIIEAAVSQLQQRDAEMIRRFYFNQERWESIAVSMHLSRSRFYEVLEKARSKVEWWLHNASRDQNEERHPPPARRPARDDASAGVGIPKREQQ